MAHYHIPVLTVYSLPFITFLSCFTIENNEIEIKLPALFVLHSSDTTYMYAWAMGSM